MDEKSNTSKKYRKYWNTYRKKESRSVLPLALRKLKALTNFWTCLIGIDLYLLKKSILARRFLILISNFYQLYFGTRVVIIYLLLIFQICRIKKDSGISFADMIFFDDESRNIRDVEKLGVLSILVKDGMSMDILKSAFQRFESQKSKKKSSELWWLPFFSTLRLVNTNFR